MTGDCRPCPLRSCSRAASRSRPRCAERLPDGAGVIAADSGSARRQRARRARRPARRGSRLGRSRAASTPPIATRNDRRAASGREGRDRSRARVRRRARRAARGGSCSSTAAATASIICSATSPCSRRPRSAGVQVEAYAGTARLAVARGGEPPVDDQRTAGQPGHACSPVGGPGARHRHRRVALPAASARSSTPGTTRGVSNELVGDVGRRSRSPSGTLLVVQPFGGAQ